MSLKFSKASSFILRAAIVVLAIIGVALLEIGWLYPRQIAVRYPTGKHLFWELKSKEISGQVWELLLLHLKEEGQASRFRVSRGGYGWGFHPHDADCSIYLSIVPVDEKASAQATETLTRRLADRVDHTFQQASMRSELKSEENGYEIEFSFKLTDDDFLYALDKHARQNG